MWKTLLAWSAAVMTTSLSGSVVQTQINLAAIAGLGHPLSYHDRWRSTLFDLGSFGPLWAAVVAFAFLLAFLVAGALARRWTGARRLLFPLAGLAAILTALLVMDAMLPVTLVAAARTLTGLSLLGLCGALGGWVYLQVTAQRQNGRI